MRLFLEHAKQMQKLVKSKRNFAPWIIPALISAGSAAAGYYGRGKKKKINLPAYDPTVAPTPEYPGIEAMPEGYYTGLYEALRERTEDPYQKAIEESQRRSFAGGLRGGGVVEQRVSDISNERAKQLAAMQENLAMQQALQERTEKQKGIDVTYDAMMKRWAAQEQAKRGAYGAAVSEAELQAQSDYMTDLQNQQLIASLLGLTGDVWSGYASSQGGK